ncbi:UNVERIFIED_CONTAM: hypothetical protein HDU68_001928, partial [Siphonaria sp. JEL0065]
MSLAPQQPQQPLQQQQQKVLLVKETILQMDSFEQDNKQTSPVEHHEPVPSTSSAIVAVASCVPSLIVVLGIVGSVAIGNLFIAGYERTTKLSRTVVDTLANALPVLHSKLQTKTEEAIARV